MTSIYGLELSEDEVDEAYRLGLSDYLEEDDMDELPDEEPEADMTGATEGDR